MAKAIREYYYYYRHNGGGSGTHFDTFSEICKINNEFMILCINFVVFLADTNDRRRSITGSTTSLTATKVLTNEEWLNHPKTIELKTELEKLKENELSEQHKAKMATEQLEDVMTEITNLRQKNETLQKNAQK